MKCARCGNTFENQNLKVCPVCGTRIEAAATDGADASGRLIQVKKSKLVAYFLAWVGFGILCPLYLNNTNLVDTRKTALLHAAVLIPLFGFGMFLLMYYYAKYMFQDWAWILSNRYRDSHRRKIWG